MSKNIILNAAPCSNAKDVANYLEAEFGLFHMDFSSEFLQETGLTEKQAIDQHGYDQYSEMRSEVLASLKSNLTEPAVITLVANSVDSTELARLGYVYQLEMSHLSPVEMAEHIFDEAAEAFCGAEIEELLAA